MDSSFYIYTSKLIIAVLRALFLWEALKSNYMFKVVSDRLL